MAHRRLSWCVRLEKGGGRRGEAAVVPCLLVFLPGDCTAEEASEKKCKDLHANEDTANEDNELPLVMNEALEFTHTSLHIEAVNVAQSVGLPNAFDAVLANGGIDTTTGVRNPIGALFW